MSFRSPRLSKQFRFQLAPLVDLLLIIVFAQFMEVRDTVTRDEATTEKESAAATQQIAEAQNRIAILDQENASLAEQLAKSQQRSESVVRQTNQAIAAVADSFQIRAISADEIETMVGDEADDVSSAVQRISREVADASPEEVVRFLVGHAELLKRAEIWHLHAMANRTIVLSAGDQSTSIQLERQLQDERTTELEDQLFAAYKQLPQPKGLVVVLVSYSPDAVAGVYQPLIDGMPKAVERMRTDLPASRFEYTVLGTTPLPEVLESLNIENSP